MGRVSATTKLETSPFASIEEAIEEIRAGRFVVVVDDEDRENEGDLTIAAQFVTPDAVNFMATHGRGLICLCLTPERCDELGLPPDDRPERGAVRDGVHGVDRGARRGFDRDLGRRPRADDPGRRRPDVDAARHRPARAHLPAPRPRRRRAEALGPDGGGRRPRAPGGARAGRRRLRDHEGRRHDGPRPGPRRVLRAPRPQARHRRRPDRVPATHREARRARRLGAAPDRLRRIPGSRVPGDADREAACRAREGRRRGEGGHARPRPLGVPDRRRLPLAALRLRRAARAGARDGSSRTARG